MLQRFLFLFSMTAVLSDVSFTAKQGEITALIGPSGGGKTTVARLAARFWDNNGGVLLYDGLLDQR